MEVLFVKWKPISKVESVLRNRALETEKKNLTEYNVLSRDI